MTPRSFALLAFAAASLACQDILGPSGPRLATVRFVNLEGGCWTITPNERTFYLPLNLPDQFKQDGMAVKVSFVQRNDMGSVCQVGPVIEILSIQSR